VFGYPSGLCPDDAGAGDVGDVGLVLPPPVHATAKDATIAATNPRGAIENLMQDSNPGSQFGVASWARPMNRVPAGMSATAGGVCQPVTDRAG
jgi:hypothetical protein